MPMLVLLAVIGLLIVAVIVLVVALFLFDSHAEQQSERLQDLMGGSASPKFSNYDRSPQEFLMEHDRELPSQPCHLCGSLRNRWRHRSDASHMPTLQVKCSNSPGPWANWFAVREKFVAKMKHAFDFITGLQRSPSQFTADIMKMVGEEQTWLKGRIQNDTGGNISPALTVLPGSSCSSEGSKRSVLCSVATPGSTRDVDSVIRSVGSVDSTVDDMLLFSNSSSSASMGATSLSSYLLPTDSGKNSETESKSVPIRRLVLEILMSPSQIGDGQVQTATTSSTSGVRLKLETNATQEHLMNPIAVPELACQIKDAERNEKLTEHADASQLLCMPVEVMPIAQETNARGNITTEQDVSSGQSTIPGFSLSSVSPVTTEISFSKSENHELCSQPEVENAGLELPCHGAGFAKGFFVETTSSSQTFDNLTVKPETAGASLKASNFKSAPSNAKVKLRFTTPLCSGSSEAASFASSEGMSGQLHSLCSGGHDQTSFVRPEGLGSLRITFLKEDTDGKISDERSKDVGSEIASALASLSVDSLCPKVAGSRGGVVSDSTKVDQLKNSPILESFYANVSVHRFNDERLQRESREFEHGRDDGEEHAVCNGPKCEGCEVDELDVKKKEKKKKKNRGRRQKGKAGMSNTEAHEQQEIGKIFFAAANHVSAVPETEIGCVCGTPKGGLHANNCPYPFTSSGSMLQRKIKEQYDELVRSNVAKTLNLAQVGRFTTCLVDAKAALQQKSEVIQRKFTIAKSLLAKADKSSFDRLCGQIYGLEMEQKKLEEDTVVYNRLQEQLKLSPAYQKMLEYGRTHFEVQPHTGQMIEKLEAEDVEMSFEELLAQEKKDTFWQKHGLSRPSVRVS